MTKDAIRHKVWTRVTAAGVVRFPGAYGRVPNFIGAEPIRAAQADRQSVPGSLC